MKSPRKPQRKPTQRGKIPNLSLYVAARQLGSVGVPSVTFRQIIQLARSHHIPTRSIRQIMHGLRMSRSEAKKVFTLHFSEIFRVTKETYDIAMIQTLAEYATKLYFDPK